MSATPPPGSFLSAFITSPFQTSARPRTGWPGAFTGMRRDTLIMAFLRLLRVFPAARALSRHTVTPGSRLS